MPYLIMRQLTRTHCGNAEADLSVYKQYLKEAVCFFRIGMQAVERTEADVCHSESNAVVEVEDTL